MKKRTIIYLLTICFVLGIATAVQADPVCTSADYCDSVLSVKEQTSPIYNTGDYSWLISADTLFPAEVRYTDGKEEASDPNPELAYACSIDGTAFVGCDSEVFGQAGTYTLRTAAVQDDELFYLESTADTALTIIDSSDGSAAENLQSAGFSVIYHDTLSDSGSVPSDRKVYNAGETTTILGNLGLNSEFNPDPLTREGYSFYAWNTSADLTGESFAFGATANMNGNLDLYPQWAEGAEKSALMSVETQELEAKQWPGEPPFGGIGTPPNIASDPNITWYRIDGREQNHPNYPSRQDDPYTPPQRWPNPQMPCTGFSTRNLTLLREQPAEMAYDMLGVSIDVPVLNVTTDLVIVPEDESGWAVDWLGDRAGLLEGSALPGEGTSFVAAHNHLNNLEAGPFLFINELAENDRVFVRDVFGKLIEYSVYANELFEPDEFAAVQEKAAEFTNALVLITCENESSEGGYLNRRVVFAKPL
ncbi:MAG: sortase [Flexilinea sp.]